MPPSPRPLLLIALAVSAAHKGEAAEDLRVVEAGFVPYIALSRKIKTSSRV